MTNRNQFGLAITEGQETLANELIGAMSEKFAVPAGEFDLVQTSNQEARELAVVYAARLPLVPDTAIHLGRLAIPTPRTKWGTVFLSRNPEKYVVEAGGEQYDTRTGMTFAVYEAMVKRAKEHRDAIPDNGYISIKDRYGDVPVQCSTFLSEDSFSDGIGEGRARIGRVSIDGAAERSDIGIGSPAPGFRPAVRIRRI